MLLPTIHKRQKPIVLFSSVRQNPSLAIRRLEEMIAIVSEAITKEGRTLDILPLTLGHGERRVHIERSNHLRMMLMQNNRSIFTLRDFDNRIKQSDNIPAGHYAEAYSHRNLKVYSVRNILKLLRDRLSDLKRRQSHKPGEFHPSMRPAIEFIQTLGSVLYYGSGYDDTATIMTTFPTPQKPGSFQIHRSDLTLILHPKETLVSILSVLPAACETHLQITGQHGHETTQELMFMSHVLSFQTIPMTAVNAMKAVSKFDLRPTDFEHEAVAP